MDGTKNLTAQQFIIVFHIWSYLVITPAFTYYLHDRLRAQGRLGRYELLLFFMPLFGYLLFFHSFKEAKKLYLFAFLPFLVLLAPGVSLLETSNWPRPIFVFGSAALLIWGIVRALRSEETPLDHRIYSRLGSLSFRKTWLLYAASLLAAILTAPLLTTRFHPVHRLFILAFLVIGPPVYIARGLRHWRRIRGSFWDAFSLASLKLSWREYRLQLKVGNRPLASWTQEEQQESYAIGRERQKLKHQ